ncbi:MAG TPA: S49 family peptidase, partial [Myxococcales bacterium]|nr:S49 family peptidase [Myxococcales bacterium]
TARALTDEERRTLQEWVDAFYGQFLDRVAEGRRLPRERVDELGRGRVWSGNQALERGLVDKIGGLREAIAAAKSRAGIAQDEPVLLDDEGKREVSFLPALQVLPGSFRPLSARVLRALSLLGEPGTLRAILPFDLEVN